MTRRAFTKHFWSTRTVATEFGEMPCACTPMKRLWFLVTLR